MYILSEYMYFILRASTCDESQSLHCMLTAVDATLSISQVGASVNIEVLSTEQGSKIVYSSCFMPHQTNASGTHSF